MNRGERRAARHYRLRGYRILGANVHAGGGELDLVVRRGRRIVFVEVKERAGTSFGGALGAVGPVKRERVRRAAAAWLRDHPGAAGLEVGFDVVAIVDGTLERLALTVE